MRISRIFVHDGDDAKAHIDYYNTNPDREWWALRIAGSNLEVSIHFNDADALIHFVAELDRLKEALEVD
jgi:hypothetical protein